MENRIFHVHAYRCRHASGEIEQEYIDKAIAWQIKACPADLQTIYGVDVHSVAEMELHYRVMLELVEK